MIRPLLILVLTLTPLAAQQTTPLRNAVLQGDLNASGHGILNLGNATFANGAAAQAFIDALGLNEQSGNRTVRSAARLYDLPNGDWAIDAGDNAILINGAGRLQSLQDQILNGTWSSNATRDAFRNSLAIPASNNATALTTGTLAAARLPTITLNTSGVLHNSPVSIVGGTGNLTLQNQAANTVLAGPTSGNATAPTFRALTSADLPGNATLSGNVSIATLQVGSLTTNQTALVSALAGPSLFGPLWLGGSGVTNAGLGVQQGSSGYVVAPVAAYFGWSSAGNLGSLHDLRIYRDDVGRLGLRQGTNPQALGVYNTFTSLSNFERIDAAWSGNVASIGPAAAGNGTLRPLTLTGSTVTVPGNTVLGDSAADTVTMNAATLTAPNASGASADALMTRQLTDNRFLWRLANWSYRERDLVAAPLSPGISTFSVNGSVTPSNVAGGNSLSLSTNATVPGNATATGLIPGSLLGNGPAAFGDNVTVWNRPMVMWIDLAAEAWRTGNTARVYWGQPETWRSGPMTANGVGFEITGATARGAVRNATTSTTTTTATMIARRNYRLTVTLNGTVAEFFVNGVSLGTLAVPSGTNAWPNQHAVAVLENDGTAAATYMTLSRAGAGFLLEP